MYFHQLVDRFRERTKKEATPDPNTNFQSLSDPIIYGTEPTDMVVICELRSFHASSLVAISRLRDPEETSGVTFDDHQMQLCIPSRKA